MGFAPETEAQQLLLTRLRSRFERVSVERVVSGSGLSNLYWALADDRAAVKDPAEIFATVENDDIAKRAVAMFYQLLGQIAGDIVLATGAFDGLFLAGGIAQRYPQQLADSEFRRAFENKGRHTKLMRKTPTALITHAQPGLLGAAAAIKAHKSLSNRT